MINKRTGSNPMSKIDKDSKTMIIIENIAFVVVLSLVLFALFMINPEPALLMSVPN